MKTAISVILGLLSGFLLNIIVGFFLSPFIKPSDAINSLIVLIFFVGGWILSSYWMFKGAKTVSKVLSRGFLLGAAEWLFMIPAGILLGGGYLTEKSIQGDSEIAGSILGAGFIGLITGTFSIVMIFICLIGFVIFYFVARESEKNNGPTKKCPSCQENIMAQAIKCRFCGTNFSTPLPVPAT